MKIILLTLAVLSNVLFQPTPISEASTSDLTYPKLEYLDNQSMSFIVEDEFYNEVDKNIYQEYKNAAFSIRQKLSFKDVPDAEFTFNQKTNFISEKMNLKHQTDVHPNRQVYFMASFQQNEKEEWHKYVVIDAETKKVLLGGNHYHLYKNPYK
ncbi:hypothetical protein MHH33_08485 [Paenisporosarcina sp. FSL H8-0542]|uniref:hypothetical protein n=1 Tax=Paenisporosarcina sp. FSL H8-0542 TaxID=2921401 RepID=UPI00315AD3E6